LCTDTSNSGRGSGASKCMAKLSQVEKWVRCMRGVGEVGQMYERGRRSGSDVGER
jgi:hypothetical protein